ncbi:MAG: GntR family transcriptional regulator [Armatimonadetes bacterium]|nr:GntR family transcriptional regulator [Armatimonadota bacterium]
MILRIDTTSSIPVYAQIVEQIKRAIASGALRGGETLPSLRDTAIKLRINPLTVSKAYKQLESDGLVETRHGMGSFVTENTETTSDGFRRDVLARAVDALLVDAVHLGVSFDELTKLIEERMEAANDSFAQDIAQRGLRDGR